MATSIVDEARIRWRRSSGDDSGDMVIYWMQQSARARDNPALELAVQQANERGQPLGVVFCVDPDYPDGSARHFQFMLEGLANVESDLARRNIAFSAVVGDPPAVLGELASPASLLVLDRGYLPIQRRWRDDVESSTGVPLVEVEGDVVVPIDLVSDKVETAARTIRPKIQEHLDHFVVELLTTALDHPAVGDGVDGIDLAELVSAPAIDLADVPAAVADLDVAAEPAPAAGWEGGSAAALRALDRFVDEVLPDYASLRNRYDLAYSSSQLSPYLHFGQLSPVEVVRRVREADAPSEDVESFVDEVVIRRELAVNYVVNESRHDQFSGLPDWAKSTLSEHADDERDGIATASELEAGETDDEVWNTIMKVIREEGWVHNQLRMYWGKQILRWTNTPGHAFRTLLQLNNRYFLDGRDANSFANVAWCFGRHDQGFQERPILGKVRPFTDQALRRKGDLDGWVEEHR